MVDVVDVLDAFEAKRKRTAKPIFEIEKWAIGGGSFLRPSATLPDGTVIELKDFSQSEGEAGRWIKNESSGWLHSQPPIKSA